MSDAAPRNGTYPPLDVPKPVAEGVWVVDSGPQMLLGLPFPVRMTVLRLGDGGLWLHSPTRYTGPLGEAIRALGPVRHLVSPGTGHWVHLPSWQRHFPEARVWAPDGVSERAAAAGLLLGPHGRLGAAAPAAWAGQIAQDMLRGWGFVEIAFHHAPSGTLVLTDTVQAMETHRLPLAAALYARAMGTAAPVGGAPRPVRLLMRRHAAANREAAARLLALAPERVIFAHGAFFAEDGAERLRNSWRWLLRGR
ncbi:DUF4336 domain-containing protein [Siccirubricoccus phaeus]|uniref:DUF4336 domain-containing protein n=1 Tax=Siccirubricoccus phaeus TaxID=2595053 RepID=UPI0011F15CA7|nr:DUF4336 domain-containing protein [Siccirubricoccus phaeus]